MAPHVPVRVRRGAIPLRGIALIEVLVTLVILLFGLLGLAGVSSRANLAEMEAYQRIQALQLVQDMADRLNANRKVANCYSNGATGVTLSASSTSLPVCTAGNVQQQTQAMADLAAWKDSLNGQAETQSGAKLGAMIGAIGCVTLDDAANNVYLIAVSWQGLHKTVAPTLADGSTAFPCGSGAYGDEKLHRVVTSKVRIGVLS
ncbi:type IV pilus modification protein PilV [Variovorax guangxiensis]|uniref:type IV pilus modification protein PilV n=1 Tax=Variovorax guangxiensis TaxID=1775474 RepID=UPI0028659A6B|nr:type IV pilus modification protein PilV [Variovorax guangxiensis]MDR6859615.1 type IV pilus assembly protein PilV [Variovorax guangxiensis]